ncbi:MAG: Ig-like domain-containing protein [Aliishimia sp.]
MPDFEISGYSVTGVDFNAASDAVAVSNGARLTVNDAVELKINDADGFLDFKSPFQTNVSVNGIDFGPITTVEFRELKNENNANADGVPIAVLEFSGNPDVVFVRLFDEQNFGAEAIPASKHYSAVKEFGLADLISIEAIGGPGPQLPVITDGDTVLLDTWLEGIPATVFNNFNATDPQGDTESGGGLEWSISGGADQNRFGITDGGAAFWSSVNPDFENPADADGDNVYELTVTVTDSDGNTDSQDVELTVLDAPESPVITDGDTVLLDTWLEGIPATVFNNFNATDPQGDTESGGGLVWSISGGADQNRFGITDGGAAFWSSVNPDFENPVDADGDNVYELTVTVTDSDGNTDSQDVELTVLDSPPVANDDVFSTNEDTDLFGNVLDDNSNGVDADPDGEKIVVVRSLLSQPDNGAVQITSSGLFQYRPDTNFNGIDTFNYTIEDGNGLTSTATVTVTVDPVNDAPFFTNLTTEVSLEENLTDVMTLTASDVDAGDVLSFGVAGGADASLFQVDPNSGALSFVNAPDFEAPGDTTGDNIYNLVVSVTDGQAIRLRVAKVTVTDDPAEIAGVIIDGTAGDDVVDGTTSPAGEPLPTMFEDIISGLGGNDELSGLGGDDIIYGNNGLDILNGNAGNDRLEGGFGNDTLFGGLDDDVLIGGDGDDVLNGGSGIDAASYEGFSARVVVSLNAPGATGQGIDQFIGIENLIGTAFNDRLTGDQDDNEIWGGDGDDVMIGLGGNDILHGQDGNDTLTGSGGDDILNGGDGDDIIDGVGGRDTLNGGAGNDMLTGDVGVDTINGGEGLDDIFGNFGVDIIDGGDGNDNIRAGGSGDIVEGGAGNDRLVGANGKDTLFGGTGNDIFYGGAGTGGGDGLRDVFVFKSAANGDGGFDIIRDFEDTTDKLDLSESGYTNYADVFADATQVGTGVEINFDFSGILRIDNFDLVDLTAGDLLF